MWWEFRTIRTLCGTKGSGQRFQWSQRWLQKCNCSDKLWAPPSGRLNTSGRNRSRYFMYTPRREQGNSFVPIRHLVENGKICLRPWAKTQGFSKFPASLFGSRRCQQRQNANLDVGPEIVYKMVKVSSPWVSPWRRYGPTKFQNLPLSRFPKVGPNFYLCQNRTIL